MVLNSSVREAVKYYYRNVQNRKGAQSGLPMDGLVLLTFWNRLTYLNHCRSDCSVSIQNGQHQWPQPIPGAQFAPAQRCFLPSEQWGGQCTQVPAGMQARILQKAVLWGSRRNCEDCCEGIWSSIGRPKKTFLDPPPTPPSQKWMQLS